MKPTVLNTDVTKVLSADSFLSALFSPDVAIAPPADPNAQADFLDLIDAVTNATPIQYRPAKDQKGVISEVCEEVSVATQATRPPAQNPTRDLQGVTADAEKAFPAFLALLQTAESVERLAMWVRFQVSTEYLQIVFWSGNDEEELARSLEVLKKLSRNKAIFAGNSIEILGPSPYGYAKGWLDEVRWAPEDFFLAYVFWAYIKGCRFARNLNDSDVYVVHWLRESVVAGFDDLQVEGKTVIGERVPWGEIVKNYLSWLPMDQYSEALKKALLLLRRYTISDSANASTARARQEFLVNGLKLINEAAGVQKQLGVDDLAKEVGKYFQQKTSLPNWASKFVARLVMSSHLGFSARATVRILESNYGQIFDYIYRAE